MPNRSSLPLSQVPAGVQPEADGRLRCLECGRWLIRLGSHIVQKHHMASDEYRVRYGLARTHKLEAAWLRQQRSQWGREAFESDPDGLRARLTPRMSAEQRIRLSVAARRESARRPGAKAVAKASGQVAGRRHQQRSDIELDRRAVAAGFAGLHAMLAATAALPAGEVATMIGVSKRRVWSLRRRHGYASPGAGRPPGTSGGQWRQCAVCGKWLKALGQHLRVKHQLSAAQYQAAYPASAARLQASAGRLAQPSDRPAPLTAAQLAAVYRGVQPRHREGRLACLECGRWYLSLVQHIKAHGMSVAGYRQRHGLPALVVLASAAQQQAAATYAARRAVQAAVRAAANPKPLSRRRQQVDELEHAARQAGYDSLHALLAATADRAAAEPAALLGVSAKAVHRLRHRHGLVGWAPPAQAAPQPMSTEELAAVPAGVQPERDGWLVCLRCGRWVRGLGQHTGIKHQMSPAEYRAEFQLPAGYRLTAPDLQARRVELGRQRFEAVADKMAAARSDPQIRARQIRNAATARQASRTRAGTRLAQAKAADKLRTVHKANMAARHQAKAQAAGYASMGELIAATAEWTHRRLAGLLQVSEGTAARIRKQHTTTGGSDAGSGR